MTELSIPSVVISAAISLDGYLDRYRPTGDHASRLILSGAEDFDAVDALRADCDALMVGAQTVRADNPRLLVRSADRRDRRIASGRPASPIRVVITSSGRLDPAAAIFQTPDTPTLVYAPSSAVPGLREQLRNTTAGVVDGGDPIDLAGVAADLGRRGGGRLLVEGGGVLNTALLRTGLVDWIRLAVAPVFVSDDRAPRWVYDDRLHSRSALHRCLARTERVGRMTVLHYSLNSPERVAMWPSLDAQVNDSSNRQGGPDDCTDPTRRRADR
ncbi:dihydrofolate reductase family protein [Microlunatus sp. Gsoil 973]|jgi:5-amino-6-(5-phosphoribosylamino)uracil reductase|uniref:dihydrofolate reductase family protein n=1 Tax=Microlunatus sp. Gsoil 973 TaxID=2672569 RepID=UPI0012B4D2E4|nr:dihydrofolate reductase family protein [Microlunatus sp. Gsoil 973]QGN34304.1 deaminase [Microlunatus sp. Gsoil 973]